MKKGLLMFTLLAASLSGAAHADSAAIKQSLAKLGVQSTDIQPSPVSGMSTVLTRQRRAVRDRRRQTYHPGADVRRERRAAGQRHQPAAAG